MKKNLDEKIGERRARLRVSTYTDPTDGRRIYKFITTNKFEYEMKLKEFEKDRLDVISHRWSEYYQLFIIEYKKPKDDPNKLKKYKDSKSLRDTVDYYSRRQTPLSDFE